MIIEKLKNIFLSILHIGVDSSKPILERQRTVYFNALLLALPLVYSVFVLKSIGSYLQPLDKWYFDQYSFFIFSFICLFCFFLNHIGQAEISKILFLVLWPLIQHIIPIIIQHTPTDFYFAYPIGLIFHSLMIQVIYSTRISPWKFILFQSINFYMMVSFLDVLQHFDTETGSELRQLAHSDFYVLVVILYWLLFNLVIYYIMQVMEINLTQTSEAHDIVEKQKIELENALEQIKSSNTKLIQSEKMASLGVFTAGIAHELNNPMNFIGSGTVVLFDILESIKKEIDEESPALKKHMQDLEKIRYSINLGVEKSTKIVQSLKEYARPNNDMHVQHNIVDSIKNALILIPNSYRQRVLIQEDYPATMNNVCNSTKLTQVFVNLLQNAIDASQDNGEVLITGRIEKKNLVFEIKDHGHGIEAHHLDKIFDPFFTTKEVGRGTGLGLYIVHDMIMEHNGTIDVYSKIGQGTTIRVVLPKK